MCIWFRISKLHTILYNTKSIHRLHMRETEGKNEKYKNKKNATPRLFSVRLITRHQDRNAKNPCCVAMRKATWIWSTYSETHQGLLQTWKGIVLRGFGGQLLRGPMIVRFKRKSAMHDGGEERGGLAIFCHSEAHLLTSHARACVSCTLFAIRTNIRSKKLRIHPSDHFK